MKFSTWLAKKYKVKVKDFDQSKTPRFWRKFKDIHAMAVKGKIVYIRDLDDISEESLWTTLVHEIYGHIRRQKRLTWFIYLARYAFSQSFRAGDEVNAYSRSMEAMHIRKIPITGMPADAAKKLDRNYLLNKKWTRWAKKRLERNMKEILSGEMHTVRTLMSEWQKDQ